MKKSCLALMFVFLMGSVCYGGSFWRNSLGDHVWCDDANWINGEPNASDEVNFHGVTGGMDNFALVEAQDIAQCQDIVLGPDGYDGKIIVDGGSLEFRTLFMGLHDKEVHTMVEVNGGVFHGKFDGQWGGKIHMGFNTNAASSQVLLQNDGEILLDTYLEVGISSPASVIIKGGSFTVPGVSIFANGSLDLAGGSITLDSRAVFEDYITAGKVLCYGEVATLDNFIVDESVPGKYTYTAIAPYVVLKADLNNDGVVNHYDLAILASEWLKTKY